MEDYYIVYALIFMAFVLFIVFTIIFMVEWKVHIDMNKETNSPYDWCTFKTFIKEFNKYKDHPDLNSEYFEDSLFLDNKDGGYAVYLHADIIKFNGKCMILYPHSYLMYRIWKYNFTKKHNSNRVKDLWK